MSRKVVSKWSTRVKSSFCCVGEFTPREAWRRRRRPERRLDLPDPERRLAERTLLGSRRAAKSNSRPRRPCAESDAQKQAQVVEVNVAVHQSARRGSQSGFIFIFTGAHKLQSFGLAGTATKRAKRGYKATTASNWVKVKPLRAKSAAQIKTRRAPNADSNGR
ncbi:BZ3500_MvSof-1268-A1-R1_Chr3-3g06379 [Microbotryum saponariae]|uniref:BZ3500_MvSof-1268-A1-R1_Chr3-3g06379 protein n=1 Tax=Microbotryum saponariae TaxID=289078 RepID=A0A2X0NFY8_9BASI|nr:BZ3500_MvSof-1268-A1-R1_Chr3-3g06379 [Microbotryum saponariae]SDA04346.1 BZ3501_MvSof-1269-A2-R1_Chr3-2g06066 [Microbotryum saponariae]